MGKIIALEYVTLDGVIEAPGGGEKFELGGWTIPYWHEEIGRSQLDVLFASDALRIINLTKNNLARENWTAFRPTREHWAMSLTDTF